ncbi:alpha/beta hydrolase [Sulfurimonas sp. HSL-1656]|uniref:alpha/beta fold hydrolase n=1 Tax=Thiomicrolovo subterrani TaxID=3131934 RepID=UPI0031F879A5
MQFFIGLFLLLFLPLQLPAAALKAYDANLSGYAYPFKVEYFTFSSQQKRLKMAYMFLEGEKSRPVVTLLHGKNFNGAYWQETARFLHSNGYGVLMPDQVGFGKSSKPADYQYSFGALAHNTMALMRSLGISRSIIVGHSMGGMLATRFALNYPHMSEKLILVNPIGLENYLHYVEYKDVDFFYDMELGKTPEKIRAYQQKNYYDGKWNAHYEALTLPLSGWCVGPDRERIAYVSALTYEMIFSQPVVEEFKDLQVPAALILGTRDRTGPGRGWMKTGVSHELGRYDRLGGEVQKRNGKIELYELPGLGHLPQVEDFGRFKTVLGQALSH